jgi:hypothetical protein
MCGGIHLVTPSQSMSTWNINDNVPTDGELRLVAGELTNGRVAGASGMRAEHVKEWLNGMQREEDPEGHGIEGAGDNWRLFV